MPVLVLVRLLNGRLALPLNEVLSPGHEAQVAWVESLLQREVLGG